MENEPVDAAWERRVKLAVDGIAEDAALESLEKLQLLRRMMIVAADSPAAFKRLWEARQKPTNLMEWRPMLDAALKASRLRDDAAAFHLWACNETDLRGCYPQRPRRRTPSRRT